MTKLRRAIVDRRLTTALCDMIDTEGGGAGWARSPVDGQSTTVNTIHRDPDIEA